MCFDSILEHRIYDVESCVFCIVSKRKESKQADFGEMCVGRVVTSAAYFKTCYVNVEQVLGPSLRR